MYCQVYYWMVEVLYQPWVFCMVTGVDVVCGGRCGKGVKPMGQ